ncbi:MAG: YfiR family protein [gamma proteobacterium symbiont of Bathyaustriella thionipta]|nr:YfiR family protein [gamma proteobacterium symbiont of Bathyaustriella thionipta]
MHSALADDEATREMRLKASFIYNMAKFVEWPAATAKEHYSSMSLCFLNADQWRWLIDESLQNKKIHGEPLILRYPDHIDDTDGCSVLFIAASNPVLYQYSMAHLPPEHVLTIGESKDFLAAGGMVNFYTEQNRLRFEINPLAAQHAGLLISSKLLSLARIREMPGASE